MSNFICKDCGNEFTTILGLSRHNSQKHNINAKETYLKYMCNDKTPVCNCGCGGETKFLSINKGFNDYIRGHAARVNNNWGHNPSVIKKSHETQKKMYENGELTVWNKGLTKETDNRVKSYGESISKNTGRGKKISLALTDVPKTEAHKKKLSEAQIKSWGSEEKREKQSNNRIQWMIKNDYTVKSKTEEEFLVFLLDLGLKEDIDFSRQFYVREIKGFFDFYIFESKILIEVDGDFWHCNPKTKFKEPKYKSQYKNLIKDEIKNVWSKTNNIQLERFWENDINNNRDVVIQRLKKIISH